MYACEPTLARLNTATPRHAARTEMRSGTHRCCHATRPRHARAFTRAELATSYRTICAPLGLYAPALSYAPHPSWPCYCELALLNRLCARILRFALPSVPTVRANQPTCCGIASVQVPAAAHAPEQRTGRVRAGWRRSGKQRKAPELCRVGRMSEIGLSSGYRTARWEMGAVRFTFEHR